jgi:hypothetical protein
MAFGAFTKKRIMDWLAARSDILADFLSAMSPISAYELTNPVASDNDGFLADFASTASTRSDSTFLSPGPAACLAYPRNVTVTVAGSGTPGHAHTSVTITGTDIDGNALTETIAGLAGGAATYAGAKAFRTVTGLAWAAGTGVGATIRVGFANVFGLPRTKERNGKPALVREIMDGAPAATAGTLVAKATGAPWGTWSPNTAPDAAHDYVLYLEREIASGQG